MFIRLWATIIAQTLDTTCKHAHTPECTKQHVSSTGGMAEGNIGLEQMLNPQVGVCGWFVSIWVALCQRNRH